jgi:hypothetical protein
VEEEQRVKPKTFTYNQMITFFIENKLPLSPLQVAMIGTKVKEQIKEREIFNLKRKAADDAKFLKREKRKQERVRNKV